MENNIEQMKQDVKTYIAYGINWVNYHTQIMKDKNEKKTEKLTKDMNEYIFRALDNIDYFEKTVGRDIFEAIAELDEEEKQFVIHAKELRAAANQNKILPKGFKSDSDYVRKVIRKLTAAQEQLTIANNQADIQKIKDEILKQYIELGRTYMFNRLEPYFDQFTTEEQHYIEDGRMAKLKSEYTEGAEKARKFLATSAKFKKVENSISQVGVDFNKAMTTKGEEMGDKVRQAGVKLSPLIIDLGEDVIELADKIEEKSNIALDKIEDKMQDTFAKIQWKGIKKHIKKECLKIVPNAPEEAIEIKARDMFYESREYILNEYMALKLKAEILKEQSMQEKGENFNEEEFQAYLSTQIPDYKKYKNFTKNYVYFYNIFVKHEYEYVNS